MSSCVGRAWEDRPSGTTTRTCHTHGHNDAHLRHTHGHNDAHLPQTRSQRRAPATDTVTTARTCHTHTVTTRPSRSDSQGKHHKAHHRRTLPSYSWTPATSVPASGSLETARDVSCVPKRYFAYSSKKDTICHTAPPDNVHQPALGTSRQRPPIAGRRSSHRHLID